LNVIQCGQGGPSIYLIVLAGENKIEADAVIWADTGSENDLILNDGNHVTGAEYFEFVTKPLANLYGIKAYAVKTKDKNGNNYPPLHLDQKLNRKISIDLPVFGSRGGKLRQACTSKWKAQGSDQLLRSLGVESAVKYFGITFEEKHRCKLSRKLWQRFEYPLVNMNIYRQQCQDELTKRNIPWLLSTQCDCCPHQDAVRWLRHSDKCIEEMKELESSWRGDFFLTKSMETLDISLNMMKEDLDRGLAQTDFMPCDNGECFT
jgi:hypothetical protein